MTSLDILSGHRCVRCIAEASRICRGQANSGMSNDVVALTLPEGHEVYVISKALHLYSGPGMILGRRNVLNAIW